MSAQDDLARAYRRLLLAYPRRYRRTRADEMLSTLLDAAEPGQRRPHWRDAANVVLRGLRCRFALPRGPLYPAAAITVALFGAVSASAAVAWSWQTSDRGPSIESAMAVARLIGVGDPIEVRLTKEPQWGTVLGGVAKDKPPAEFPAAPASVLVSVPALGPDAARARLIAEGWRAGEASTDHRMRSFWAERDGLIVWVSDWDESVVAVRVFGRMPSWLEPAVGAAALAGLAGGWLLAGWAMRAWRRHGSRGRAGVLVLAVPGLLAAAASVVYVAFGLLVEAVSGGWPAAATALVTAGRDMVPFSGTAVIAFAGAAAIVSEPRSSRQPSPANRPASAWRILAGTTAAAHAPLAAVACGVIVAYAVGHPTDPKELVPFGYGQANPFVWAFDIVVVLYILGIFVSPALLAVSVPLLVFGRLLRLPRTSGMWTVLLLAAVTSVVPLALAVSPLGHAAGVWLMD
jgi:hypothetical protein